jgi:hypothetical protein
MPEMLIETPIVLKTLHDYDILFDSGMMIPITVDLASGDTISFNDLTITVQLTAKPSLNDPAKVLPAEDITIFNSHIVSIQHRQREIQELSPEEKYTWQETFKELSKAIN